MVTIAQTLLLVRLDRLKKLAFEFKHLFKTSKEFDASHKRHELLSVIVFLLS